MATRTQTELATEVMRHLGLLDASELPSADDREFISRVYADKAAELKDKGLVYWPLNEIPAIAFTALKKLIAAEVAIAFGVTARLPDPTGELAERELRRQSAARSTGETVGGSFY